MENKMFRYSAQRFGSWDWLEFDLPLTTDGPEFTYSSYGRMTATVSPEVTRRIADDGRRLIEPWGTLIHVEAPGERKWTGIVDEVYAVGAEMTIEIREWVGYFDGIVFMSNIWETGTDPVVILRKLVNHAQSYPTGNLGITVTGSTPVRLGTPYEDDLVAARVELKTAEKNLKPAQKNYQAKGEELAKKSAPFDKAIKALEAQKKPLKAAYDALMRQQKPKRDAYTNLTKERTLRTDVYEALVAAKASKAQIAAAKAAVDALKTPIANAKAQVDLLNPAKNAAKAPLDAKQAQINVKKAEKALEIAGLKDQKEALKEIRDDLKEIVSKAKDKVADKQEIVDEKGGAYKVSESDHPDIWSEIESLAEDAPFDFRTRSVHSNGAPKLYIDVIHPKITRQRDDLVFEQGINIVEPPEVEIPEDYASEIVAIGAGQGETVKGYDIYLETNISEDDPRMRRTKFYSDPEITKQKSLDRVARKELRESRVKFFVPEIEVIDHDNCRIGSWEAGDIITVKLHDVPHFGRIVVKQRIKSWSWVGTNKARLELEAV